MDILKDSFVLDGCVFAEGDFNGCSKDIATTGLDAFFLTIPHSSKGFSEAVQSIGRIYQLCDAKPEELRVVRTVNEMAEAARNCTISIILAFQDPYPIGNSIDRLRVFYELGVRVIQLTYNKAGYIGTGCAETADRGLTDFGRRVIDEMNRLGILVDLSHCSTETALDALKHSSKPVVFSHSAARRISDSPRNRTDEELKLLTENGGVIGISPWGPLCWKRMKKEQPTLDDYIDHVDYVVNLIGIDHVGFGSDNTVDYSEDREGTLEQSLLYPTIVAEYDRYIGTEPDQRHAIGFRSIREIGNVVEKLRERGYTSEDIK
ncbi:MAG: membrane dipeptidase [Bacillota bacterium]|jgi:membrane dipeptidase